jgi:class 3 adenylate cyclase
MGVREAPPAAARPATARPAAERTAGIGFSLRLKIILTFLVVGLAVSGLMASVLYRILAQGLLAQVQARVLDLAELSSKLVDVDALARLRAKLVADPAPGLVEAVEASADFRLVSDALGSGRAVERDLVHYIYLFVPTLDPDLALYLVDADVLAARERADSAAPETDGVSHFGSPFDLSEFPVARRALAERNPFVEEGWTYDAEFRVNSITAYAPINSRDGSLLAVLGIDIVDTDVRRILSRATTVTLAVIVGALVLTMASAILLGTLFTRGIVSLDQVVRRFDKNNLQIRARVRSRDEVGRLGVSFNAMAETIQQYSARLEALLGAYGRFVPHQLLRLLQKGSILDVRLGDYTEREMTVLFSDIIAFTSLSESMTPFENFNFINSYLKRMGPAIRDNRGFIDKYIGDGIMALFPDDPDDALAAAVEMQAKLGEYNSHREKSGYRPIAVGIGVNAGSLMLGTVGEHERMDGSVISDAVNLSSRLQSLTRIYGASVLTTGQTLKKLKNPGRFHCRFIDRIRVRGRKETVLLFEVLDGVSAGQREKKLAYRPALARALRLYFSKDFTGALGIVLELAKQNPDDEVLRIYRKRCELLTHLGVPDGWQGVEDISAK